VTVPLGQDATSALVTSKPSTEHVEDHRESKAEGPVTAWQRWNLASSASVEPAARQPDVVVVAGTGFAVSRTVKFNLVAGRRQGHVHRCTIILLLIRVRWYSARKLD
jgi:hypothetical protein